MKMHLVAYLHSNPSKLIEVCKMPHATLYTTIHCFHAFHTKRFLCCLS